jgi:uridine phosphorylase
MIKSSELIIKPDGSIYHLNAKPGQLAHKIITVGDPERVKLVEAHFDKIIYRIHNREFVIVTGKYRGEEISIISTGIGTDNVDIVFNELDALFNIEFASRKIKPELQKLKIIRIGTSGAINEKVPLDSFILSAYAIGLDSLLHFYKSKNVRELALEQQLKTYMPDTKTYAVRASEHLMQAFESMTQSGITITAPGFYAPQARSVRLGYRKDLISILDGKKYGELSFTNLEMETSGIYGLAKMLGHEAISLNAILANRKTGEFSQQPQKTVQSLIAQALEVIVDI